MKPTRDRKDRLEILGEFKHFEDPEHREYGCPVVLENRCPLLNYRSHLHPVKLIQQKDDDFPVRKLLV